MFYFMYVCLLIVVILFLINILFIECYYVIMFMCYIKWFYGIFNFKFLKYSGIKWELLFFVLMIVLVLLVRDLKCRINY